MELLKAIKTLELTDKEKDQIFMDSNVLSDEWFEYYMKFLINFKLFSGLTKEETTDIIHDLLCVNNFIQDTDFYENEKDRITFSCFYANLTEETRLQVTDLRLYFGLRRAMIYVQQRVPQEILAQRDTRKIDFYLYDEEYSNFDETRQSKIWHDQVTCWLNDEDVSYYQLLTLVNSRKIFGQDSYKQMIERLFTLLNQLVWNKFDKSYEVLYHLLEGHKADPYLLFTILESFNEPSDKLFDLFSEIEYLTSLEMKVNVQELFAKGGIKAIHWAYEQLSLSRDGLKKQKDVLLKITKYLEG